MTNSINKHYMFKISYTQNTNFKPLIIINCIRQTKSKSNIYIYLIFNIASIILLISLFSHLNFKIKLLESFTKSTLEFWQQNNRKWGWGFANYSQNCNAGFVKPILYNIFSYILFNVFDWRNKTLCRKKIQNMFYFFYATV